jgi:DNA-binding transcriptional regulator PaaX
MEKIRYIGKTLPSGEREIDVGWRPPSGQQKQRRRFLKGPIPIEQVAVVSQLPGKAFVLWLLIRHRADVTGKPEVTLPSELLERCGIGRDAKARGLRRLAKAGEIQVERRPGHSVRVRLISPRKRRTRR